MAEYSSNAVQTVNPGETVIFTESPFPCKRGLVRHRDDSGSFLLSGWTPTRYSPCGCRARNAAEYLTAFGANIAIPEGGTAGPISLALSLDGSTLPATTMIVTPAAVNEYFNVSVESSIGIWNNCCESLAVRNTSDQPILVQNANIIFSRPDLVVSY